MRILIYTSVKVIEKSEMGLNNVSHKVYASIFTTIFFFLISVNEVEDVNKI